jgi:hypothetical protein
MSWNHRLSNGLKDEECCSTCASFNATTGKCDSIDTKIDRTRPEQVCDKHISISRIAKMLDWKDNPLMADFAKKNDFGSLTAHATSDLFRKLSESRSKIVERIAKKFIKDKYGDQYYPLLLPCINQEVQGNVTVYVFTETTEFKSELRLNKIPLVRFIRTTAMDPADVMTHSITVTENYQILV